MAIFDQAQKAPKEQGGFTPPPVESFVPEEHLDAVQRVVAAGMKLVYQGDMAEDVKAELARDVPVAQMLAEASVGWLLILDKQAPQGIPEHILAYALQALVGEAAEIATQSGRAVSADEFEDAVMLAHQLMARKLGYNDEQIMQGAQQGMQQAGAQAAPAGPAPEEAMQ